MPFAFFETLMLAFISGDDCPVFSIQFSFLSACVSKRCFEDELLTFPFSFCRPELCASVLS
jgi:hypothetical protein